MNVRRIGAAVIGALLITTLSASPKALAGAPSPAPSPAGISKVVISYADLAQSADVSAQTVGGKVTAASIRAASANAKAARVKGTILAEPTPRTVKQELALAARTDQTYEPETLAGGAVSAMAAHDYMTVKECGSKAQSTHPGGWYKNHWSWCQSLTLYIYNILDGYIIGRGSFQSTIVGRGYSGTRKITIDQYIGEVGLSGTWQTYGPALKPYMSCRGIPKAKHCKVSGGKKYLQLTEGSTHHIKYTMTSSSKDASRGSEKVSIGIFTPKYTIRTPRATATESGYTQGFRCDSAPYLGSRGACIFDRVRGTFTLKRSDRAVSQAAQHIRAALRGDKNLYPAAGKKMPSVLTRETNKKAQAANTAKAKAACKKKWHTRPAGKDCDEYPFESVTQGAAKARGKFSVRYINSGQNQEAGRRLGRWMQSDRILDGDKFKVKIK